MSKFSKWPDRRTKKCTMHMYFESSLQTEGRSWLRALYRACQKRTSTRIVNCTNHKTFEPNTKFKCSSEPLAPRKRVFFNLHITQHSWTEGLVSGRIVSRLAFCWTTEPSDSVSGTWGPYFMSRISTMCWWWRLGVVVLAAMRELTKLMIQLLDGLS